MSDLQNFVDWLVSEGHQIILLDDGDGGGHFTLDDEERADLVKKYCASKRNRRHKNGNDSTLPGADSSP